MPCSQRQEPGRVQAKMTRSSNLWRIRGCAMSADKGTTGGRQASGLQITSAKASSFQKTSLRTARAETLIDRPPARPGVIVSLIALRVLSIRY